MKQIALLSVSLSRRVRALTISLALVTLLLRPAGADASSGASRQCPDLVEASYWLEEIRPLFTATDSFTVEFRQLANLQFVDSLSAPVHVVTDSTTCAAIEQAATPVLSGTAYYQENPYNLVMLRFGPYYAVAVDESPRADGLVQGGPSLILVLAAGTLEVLRADILM